MQTSAQEQVAGQRIIKLLLLLWPSAISEATQSLVHKYTPTSAQRPHLLCLWASPTPMGSVSSSVERTAPITSEGY